MHLHFQNRLTTALSALVLLAASVVMSAQTMTLRAAADREMQNRQYERAARLYEAYIKDHPGDPAAYDGLAQAFEKLGRSKDAAVAYEKEAALLEKQAGAATAAAMPQPVRAPQARAAAFAPPAPAHAAATTGGRLDGLYLMTRFWPGSGLELATYYFHNGSVVLNPIAGGNGLNVEAERAAHPKAVGTFRLANGQLTLALEGSNQTAKFEDDKKGCFGWDAGIFCPVEVFKPGTTLNGTFTGGASSGGGGAVMSSTAIAFKPDGTYQRDSVGTFTTRTNASTISGGSTGQESGRYRIDGTAMHLMPNGGKETVVTTFPYDDGTTGPAPRKVYFGGAMLNRK